MTRASRLDRRALFASGAAAALLAATGVSAHGAPRRGGRLKLAVSGGARSDSWTQGRGLFMQVARLGLVHDSLTEIAADGTLRGELATGWQSFDDARRWRVDLRRDARFHDGSKMTARDVVASLSRHLGNVQEITAHQVEFHLPTPQPHFPFLLASPDWVIDPAHAPGTGIGTGLYQVREFKPGRRIVATRVGSHYKDGKAGWFDEVDLVSITAEAVRVQAVTEFLVDAADANTIADSLDLADVDLQPDPVTPLHAVSSAIAQPVRVGHRLPFDDLRAAERWWFA